MSLSPPTDPPRACRAGLSRPVTIHLPVCRAAARVPCTAYPGVGSGVGQ
ncbi:MAG TPA: hypothetical protein PKC73_12845 [Dermatophilaceae bacterium]|nr:hypothetical protein [Actinomycetales bacterium]HMT32924.1 hypothetical protein [Dermatophilaceae bacterium]HMT90513.1 hypothetical protein [Dermatophilaceae bacterium]